ncbi:MAG: alpha/beta fold hydrolase [Bacilli bacterium]|nr:alpha/beta fold hydrolase [Bacilli bacterium]
MIKNVKMHTAKEGNINMRRIAILIIHGFAGGTYDQEDLAFQLELINEFDVYSFTLPGHDKYVVKKVTSKDWLETSENYIQKLINAGYKNIYLIGHSMGGVISCHLANKYKEVKKLVLASPAFECMSSKNGTINILGSLKQTPKVIKRFDGLDELISRIIKFPIKTVKEFQQLITTNQQEPEKINIPTLIIQGTKDDMVPYNSTISIFNKIPHKNKKLVLVENLNHNVFRNIHEQEIIDITINFLLKKPNFNKDIQKIK